MAELVRTVNFAETFAALRLGESVEFSVAEFTESSVRANASRYCKGKNIKLSVSALRGGKSSVSCPLKPSDSAPLKHSTMPP
mgnify:CR=1 FL=1